MDLSWSLLCKNTKISNFLAKMVIRFDQISTTLKNYSKYLWIQSLFNIILVNSCLKLKIGDFGIYFDTNLCVFNDRVNLFCQRARTLERERERGNRR